MSKNETTSAIIDEIIRLAAGGFYISSALLAPGSAIGLAKPLDALLKLLDERKVSRDKRVELRRIIYYMKEQGYLAGEYEHGLQLTSKARKRLAKADSDVRHITPQPVWDGWWRIIIYDIPENMKSARQILNRRLRLYGCFELQQSVLITPFPCAEDISKLAVQYGVEKYMSYFEAKNLANPKPLLQRFKKKYPETKFQ